MSRSDQFIGLPERARRFLELNAVKERVEIVVDGVKENEFFRLKKVPGKYKWEGAFDNGDELPGYLLMDGTILYETIQAEPWSSGPMIFTCLEYDDGTKPLGLKWKKKEINEMVY